MRLCLSSFLGLNVGVLLCGTCGAPRVIVPWRGEREWFPVSNPASCWDVDMRENGRSRRLFRGSRRYFYSLPLGSPIWELTAHVGGRPPSRVHPWVSPHFFSLSRCWLLPAPIHQFAISVAHFCRRMSSGSRLVSSLYSSTRVRAVSQRSACICLHIVGPLQLASAVILCTWW